MLKTINTVTFEQATRCADISAGLLTSQQIREYHPCAEAWRRQRAKRQRLACGLIPLHQFPAIIAEAKRRGWVK